MTGCVCAETSIRNCPVHGQGQPSGRCAATEALERIANPPEVLYGYANELVRIARAALASPCCVSANNLEQVKDAHGVAGEWDGEHCQRCSRAYSLVWAAPNDLWNRIIGSEGGLCCPDCFVEECRAAGVHPLLVCFPEHVDIRAALALLGSPNEEEGT